MKYFVLSALMAGALALPANATPPAVSQASEPAKVQDERIRQQTETVHRRLSERRAIEQVRKVKADEASVETTEKPSK